MQIDKNTSKSREHCQFDNTCTAFGKHAANTENATKYINGLQVAKRTMETVFGGH